MLLTGKIRSLSSKITSQGEDMTVLHRRRGLRFLIGVFFVSSISLFAQRLLLPSASATLPLLAGQQGSPGDASTLAEYVFSTPPGWTATQYPDGITLMSPPSATNERCIVTLWPMRPAGSNLIGDADQAFRQVWGSYQRRDQTQRGTPMPPTIVRGTSGQGWDYVIVRRGIGPPGSPETRLGLVMVARLNNRLAVISGLSKDPLVSTCFGELAYNAWPRFFYSLRFKNWTTTDQAAALRKRIIGVWTIATAS